MVKKGVQGGQVTRERADDVPKAVAVPVEWGDESAPKARPAKAAAASLASVRRPLEALPIEEEDLEELETTEPDEGPEPVDRDDVSEPPEPDDEPEADEEPAAIAKARAPARAPAKRSSPPAVSGKGTGMKLAAVAVVLVLVCAGLGAMLLYKPGGGGGGKPKPPAVVNDTVATPDVFISEVMPAYAAYGSTTPFVEVRANSTAVPDLKDWKLTTYDNDSFLFPSSPVTNDPAYVLANFTPSSPVLSLGASDEMGLYDPQGRLVDFVRWGGGNSNTSRGVWPAASPGVFPAQGDSISRLDSGRFDPAAWSASPPSPGEPNIYAVDMSGVRQVLWIHTGRSFDASIGAGGAFSLPPGRWVPKALLLEAASHLEYSIRQLRRLGDPLPVRDNAKGSPVLEFWLTNGSVYRGITETSGRVSLDLGDNRHVNSYVCAREMACLIELAKWGPPTERNLFLREGLATAEGMRTAASEITPSLPSIDGLWMDMRAAGLYNPFDNGRDLSAPFIFPWSYDPDHLAPSWLFYDSCERRFVESGLGSSLAQALLFAGKDPYSSLPEQLGRNLTVLYWDWLAGRTAPGYKYATPLVQWSGDLGPRTLDGSGMVPAWTAWTGRFNISFSGSAELRLATDPGSPGPIQFTTVSARTGVLLARNVVQPGQSVGLVASDLRPLDELMLLAGGGEVSGGMAYHASQLPPPPSDLDPRDGSYSNQSRPVFGWSKVAGVASYEVQLSRDRTFAITELEARPSTNAFQPASNLTEGRHYWRVRGWTVLGNPTEWSGAFNFTVDTVPPFAAPSIGEPRYRASPDDLWNVTQATPIGFTHEATETVFFRFSDNETWQNYSNPFVLGGDEGTWTVQYYSRDGAGNAQSVQVLGLHLDTRPPVLSIGFGSPSFAAAPGDVLNLTTSTRVLISSKDNWSGVKEVKYRLDSKPFIPYTGELNLSGMPEGLHVISATSTDRLGNGAPLLMEQFFIDMTPPVFNFQNLSNGTFLNGKRLINVVGADRSGIASVSYLVDNVAQYTQYSPPYDWLWDTSQLSDDSHLVQARAQDHVGNIAGIGVTVGTENTVPSTTLAIGEPKYRAAPLDTWNVTGSTFFNLSVVHTGHSDIPTWYTIDGVYSEGRSFKLQGLPNGPHNLTYGSRGLSGLNETAKCITVNIDNQPPQPVITGPLQSDIVLGNISLNASEVTGATDVRNCTFSYSQDTVNWIEIAVDDNGADGWSVFWNTTSVANGNYWIQAEMVDLIGNKAFQSIVVLVQNP